MAPVSIRPPEEVPAGAPMSVSTRRTSELNTGDWRTMRPVFATRESPCNLSCPAGTDVRKFLQQAGDGDVTGAWLTILEHNPFPGVCGRVCYHPCEAGCNRAYFDEGIAVHAVERAVADTVGARGVLPPLPRARTGRTVAVVGAGPSGLSCAYHLARRGHAVTVYDEGAEPGGMLRYGIPAYRLPRPVLSEEIDTLRALGVSFVPSARVGETIAWSALDACDAVFLGVGAQRSRRARIPGEELAGVRPALSYLREANAGRLATSRGRVVVIGGGNTAIDAARVARRAGAPAVVIYRRSREDMPAHPDEVRQAEEEGIEIVCQATPLRVLARDGRAGAVLCQRTRPGAPDASGRAAPEPIPGATFSLACMTVLTAVGEELDADAVGALVDTTAGRLCADSWGRTDRSPAIFAGGDAVSGAATVVEAIGSGRRAAEAIDAWLAGRAVKQPHQGACVTRAEVNFFYFRPAARVDVPRLKRGRALRGFDEVVGSIQWRDATAEAARCLSCGECTQCDTCVTFCPDAALRADASSGGYAIDLAHCKGCGICAAECPRGVIRLVPEDSR